MSHFETVKPTAHLCGSFLNFYGESFKIDRNALNRFIPLAHVPIAPMARDSILNQND